MLNNGSQMQIRLFSDEKDAQSDGVEQQEAAAAVEDDADAAEEPAVAKNDQAETAKAEEAAQADEVEQFEGQVLEPLADTTGVQFHALLPNENFTFITSDYFDASLTDCQPPHPGNRKVKMVVKLEGIDLPAENQETLHKLCGPRYNKGKNILTLVCDQYTTKAKNQKVLIDLFRDIVEASKQTYADS